MPRVTLPGDIGREPRVRVFFLLDAAIATFRVLLLWSYYDKSKTVIC